MVVVARRARSWEDDVLGIRNGWLLVRSTVFVDVCWYVVFYVRQTFVHVGIQILAPHSLLNGLSIWFANKTDDDSSLEGGERQID